MKTYAFIHSRLCLILFSFLAITFTSCDKDDDDGGDSTTPQAAQSYSYEVELLDIRATDASSAEGEVLEVYGNISATLLIGNLSDEEVLWNRSQQANLPVGESDVELGIITVFTIDADDLEASEIRLHARLTDHDSTSGNDDEFIGDEQVMLNLSDVEDLEIYEINLNDTPGHHVRVRFTVKPV